MEGIKLMHKSQMYSCNTWPTVNYSQKQSGVTLQVSDRREQSYTISIAWAAVVTPPAEWYPLIDLLESIPADYGDSRVHSG